jgi:hypothetical protein
MAHTANRLHGIYGFLLAPGRAVQVPPWLVALVFTPLSSFMRYLFVAEVGVALYDYYFPKFVDAKAAGFFHQFAVRSLLTLLVRLACPHWDSQK